MLVKIILGWAGMQLDQSFTYPVVGPGFDPQHYSWQQNSSSAVLNTNPVESLNHNCLHLVSLLLLSLCPVWSVPTGFCLLLEIKRQYRDADTLSEAFYYLCFPKKADRNEIAAWATRKPELRASLEEAPWKARQDKRDWLVLIHQWLGAVGVSLSYLVNRPPPQGLENGKYVLGKWLKL